ncbi:hypothetical protein M3Y95_00445800 [Aphelenchoides besseyi]|nr:hypothetical protein M3Y95_00445800 [Aphelenchoides besseyi]
MQRSGLKSTTSSMGKENKPLSAASSVETPDLENLVVKRSAVADPTLQAEWSQKKLVWIPHEREGFVAASIKSETEGMVTVEIVETGQQVKLSKDDCQMMNPPKFDKVEDMADLTCLNEASVLHNLKDRYYSNLIYTYSGLFCVVLNPYKHLNVYSEDLIEAFKGKKRHERPPHIFAIADCAYRSMLQEREDQSILCTGESGAGKTENTKKVIQYLAHVASSNRGKTGELEQQLLQTNPVLEAFGNSKTIKNDNSSRFGKFIRINFDFSGYISGANIEFYLLEKSRCCRQAAHERSFHIFYQFLRGTSAAEKQNYLLEDLSSYAFLKNGDVQLPNVDDAKEFAETLKSMKIMGFDDSEITALLRVVSAVLLFGNIKFTQDKKSDQAGLNDDRVAQKVCHLLGLPVQEFTKAFLRPKIKVGRETVQKAQNQEQCEFAVEAISKACYERMFKWLVQRLNKSLDRTRRQGTSFIGILDIAGFEIFDLNSFEQLSINYTNEKLQQLFNSTMFVREQEEYQREGIEWNFIDFGLDLQPTIDLIEKQMGIFSLLDEQCLFPKATDKTLVEKLIQNHQSHPKFVVPEMLAKSDFAVVHYAGRVDYSAEKWLVKNMDPLNDNVVSLMQNSSDQFVASIWKDAEFAGMSATEISESAFGLRTKKGMFRTVSHMYKEQLNKLMSTLNNTVPNFVRCIIPNHEKKPGRIDALLILEQLRCNGVLEGIRICRKGFPNRIQFHEFRHRYEMLAPNAVPKGFMDGKESTKKILDALEIEPGSYRVGMSKVFFRAGVLAKLEEARDTAVTQLVIGFQARCRAFLARRAYSKRMHQETAIIVVQRNCQAWLKLRNWDWWRLFTKVKPLLQITNQEAALQQRDDEIKVARERLQKTETEFKDLEGRLDTLTNERDELQRLLQRETEERSSLDEERDFLASKYAESNELLNSIRTRLEEEEQRAATSTESAKKNQEQVRDLYEQLELEEQKRQKVQLEKAAVDERLKRAEERNAELEDQAERQSKERKQLEDRVAQMTTQLAEDEEKIRQASKQRTRVEGQVVEFEEELERLRVERAELDAKLSAANSRVQQKDEALEEVRNKATDLLQQLKVHEEALAKSRERSDIEHDRIAELEKRIRELQVQIEDLQDDLENERSLRAKAEQRRNVLAEEYEKLKNECVQAVDRGTIALDIQKKKDEELRQLQVNIEAITQDHQELLDNLRQKHQTQLEALNEELAQQKRLVEKVDRTKVSMEQEKSELATELGNLQASRNESEKKRKLAEATIAELQVALTEAQREREQSAQQLAKLQPALETTSQQREELEEQLAAALRKAQSLETQLADTQDLLQQETRQKLNALSQIRTLQTEQSAITEHQEGLEEQKRKLEAELNAARNQIAEEVRKSDEQIADALDEQKKRFQKELEKLQVEIDDAVVARDRADRGKKKLQEELDDIAHELETTRAANRDFEKQQRKFDQQQTEDRNALQAALRERDALAQACRDQESKILNLEKSLDAMEQQKDEHERAVRTLQLELDEMISSTDDAGRNAHDLEHAKRQLEQEIADLRAQVEELEDGYQLAEDARLRLEVTNQALKAEHERTLATKEQEDEDRRRALSKKLGDLEAELDSERRNRNNTLSQKKRVETQIGDLENQLEMANRQKEDLNRQLKRYQQQFSTSQTEINEIKAERDRLTKDLREAERRMREALGEAARIQEAYDSVVIQKRAVEAERDELEERQSHGGMLSGDEKRNLEAEIQRLTEELENEQENAEQSLAKMRRAQQLVDQNATELDNERKTVQRLEELLQRAERESRELRSSNAETEMSLSRLRKENENLSSRVRLVDEQLRTETTNLTNLQRNLRRTEKKVGELNAQIEEERRVSERFKEEADRANSRSRQLRRQVDEVEDELARERAKVRGLQRELDELAPSEV